MDLNPIDDIGDAVSRKKKQLVRYIKNKTSMSSDAPARGTGNRQPKYYRSQKRTPFRRP